MSLPPALVASFGSMGSESPTLDVTPIKTIEIECSSERLLRPAKQTTEMKSVPSDSPSLLVVDDEQAQRELLGGFLESHGIQVSMASSAEAMLEIITTQPPDMILLDVRLPKMSGIDAIPEVRKVLPEIPLILITAYADVRQAVEAVKRGADDYLSKPVDLEELKVVVFDALAIDEDGTKSKNALPEIPADFVFKSPSMWRLVETIAVVAPSDVPILIQGPSGSGKEWIAQLIHKWSHRAAHPIVTTNCAGLSPSLVESELFGHIKGAFTGASESRKGLFRTASGGSLFLDEIGEMPLEMQPKLLRVLESNQVTPVGADRPESVDTRLIAATNRDLMSEVKEGRFREDLYYRLNVVELIVPGLSDRREDIIPLAKHFASQFANRQVRFSPQATKTMLSHHWNGNVRELRNAMQRACLLCQGDVIMPEHLPSNLTKTRATDPPSSGRLSQVESATILATLEECNGNRTQAAKVLGISRRALIYKLRAIEDQIGHESSS